MSKETKPADFEATLAELEKIVGELEGDVKLERALALFERGVKLSGDCRKYLKTAEQQIAVLKRTADGELITEALVETELGNEPAK